MYIKDEGVVSKRVLVYDSDKSRIKIINQKLKGLDWEIVNTDDPGLVEGTFAGAFVSLQLPYLDSLESNKIISIIDKEEGGSDSLRKYSSVSYLITPVSDYEIVRSIECFRPYHGSISKACYLGSVADIKISAKILCEQLRKYPLSIEALCSAIDHYCLYECESSHVYSSDSKEEVGNNIINISEKGKIKICPMKDECQLRRFSEFLHKKKNVNISSSRVLVDSLTLTIDELLNQVTKFMTEVYYLHKNYCTDHCDHSRNDINFKEGDVLLVDFKDMLNGSSAYCDILDCKHYEFFHYFKNCIGPM